MVVCEKPEIEVLFVNIRKRQVVIVNFLMKIARIGDGYGSIQNKNNWVQWKSTPAQSNHCIKQEYDGLSYTF